MSIPSATSPSSPTVDPVEQARLLAPSVREAANEIEAERRLPRALVEQLREAGLFQLFVPADFGGLEVDPGTACRAIEEVAAADGSAGWCLMIATQNAALTGFLPPAEAATILDGGRSILAGVARPIGRAVSSPDGATFTVSGRWPFA